MQIHFLLVVYNSIDLILYYNLCAIVLYYQFLHSKSPLIIKTDYFTSKVHLNVTYFFI